MKKTTKLWFMFALAGMVAMSSCKKDTEEEETPTPTPTPVDACADATYPTSDGDATIEVLNFTGHHINVEAGNTLALAVQVTRGTKRAKKIRLFQSDCENTIGDEIDLSDQPKGGKNGIDLRATDDAQVRNVNYAVPSGFTTIYLTVQVDETGDLTVYKQLKLMVSGSGIIDTWTDVELGGNTNALGSRMSSGTGQTYLACNAAENIEYIDITYAVSLTSPYNSYLCSNPARFLSPIGLSASSASCGDDGTLQTDGGLASNFKASTADFDAADNAILEALTVSAADPEFIHVMAVGDVFEFRANDGRLGLIKVMSTTGLNDVAESLTVSVKIAR